MRSLAVEKIQEMMQIPLEYEFILYKHGPYSFDLKEELTALRADSILELKSTDPRYGASFFPGKMGEYVIDRFPKTIAKYEGQISFVATCLGEKNVGDLERLATALYVLRDSPNSSPEQRASRIVEYKPHIVMQDSKDAVDEVERMIQEASNQKL